jgi:hypothetical protein
MHASKTIFQLQFEGMSELEMDTHAAYAAEYFWWVVRKNIQSQKLLKADLLDRLNGDEQGASYAFSLFDLDGDGYVVEEEVQARFQKIYRSATCRALLLTALLEFCLLANVGGCGVGSWTDHR